MRRVRNCLPLPTLFPSPLSLPPPLPLPLFLFHYPHSPLLNLFLPFSLSLLLNCSSCSVPVLHYRIPHHIPASNTHFRANTISYEPTHYNTSEKDLSFVHKSLLLFDIKGPAWCVHNGPKIPIAYLTFHVPKVFGQHALHSRCIHQESFFQRWPICISVHNNWFKYQCCTVHSALKFPAASKRIPQRKRRMNMRLPNFAIQLEEEHPWHCLNSRQGRRFFQLWPYPILYNATVLISKLHLQL